MKVLLATLVVIAVTMAEGALAPGLRVKFGRDNNPSAGASYFFNLPVTVSEALEEGWRKTKRPPGPMPQLDMYCAQNKVICLLYDDLEDVAGLQVALSKANFTNNVFDWETRGFTKWNTAINGKCETMYTQHLFLVSEENLQKSKEERRQARDSRILKENAIWVKGTNGELRKISSSEQDISDEQDFTKQACTPWMGRHWYYNMTRTTPCDAENIYPWFPLTFEGELIATGFLTVGNLPVATDRDWVERPGVQIVETIVPRETGPDCLYELTEDPGVVTMHIYYTATPWLITC